MIPTKAAVSGLITPFLVQEGDQVHVSLCCGRLYAGVSHAVTCRTCKQTPVDHTLGFGDDFDPEVLFAP